MTLKTTGEFGIGNANPTYKLDVAGDINFTGDLYESGALLNLNGDFSNSGENAGANRNLGNIDNFNLGLITNNTTRLQITNDGKIGFGITSPNYELQINSSSTTSSIQLTQSSSGSTGTDGLIIQSDLVGGASIMQKENQKLILGTSDTDRIIIEADGRVGIGVNPTQKFEVEGRMVAKALILGSVFLNAGSHSAIDVSEIGVIACSTNTGNVTINDFINGVSGQVIRIVQTNFTNAVTLTNDSGANQRMLLSDSADIVLNGYEGMTIVLIGGIWYRCVQ